MSTIRDPSVRMFLIELMDWDERNPYDLSGINDLIGYAMLTPAELMTGVFDRPLTWARAEHASSRKVPGYVSIEPLTSQMSQQSGYQQQPGAYQQQQPGMYQQPSAFQQQPYQQPGMYPQQPQYQQHAGASAPMMPQGQQYPSQYQPHGHQYPPQGQQYPPF
jgi:hypothetical protein